MQLAARGVLIAAALTWLLTGCTSAQQLAPTDTPAAPTAAATAVPRPLAGGDCANLLDSNDLAVSLGGSTDAKVGTVGRELGLVGGIGCVFNFGEQGSRDHGQVLVDVAPAAIADPGELDASLTGTVCDHESIDLLTENAGCTATVAVSGWWYRLSVFSFESSESQETSFQAITTMLEQALASAEAPARASAVEPFDCNAADTGGLVVSSSRELPESGQGAIALAAARLAVPVTCAFTTADGSQWYVAVYPANMVAYELCASIHAAGAPAGSPVSVPGIQSAFVEPPAEDGSVRICATDGLSTATVLRGAGVWDAASLENLGSLVVPVLASAG
ncbi:MAG: hypothetical protein ABJB03_05015 [Rhodoglobus sp.]